MSDAKTEILQRLRTALDQPRPNPITALEDVPRDYQGPDAKAETTTGIDKVLAALTKTLTEYGAGVQMVEEADVADTIAELLDEGAVAVHAPDLPEAWLPSAQAQLVADHGSLDARSLDDVDAVITGCHTAIAMTGTLALKDDGIGGRRIISLIPDHHIVVVRPEDTVVGVPACVQRMREDDPSAAWTWISGPSATSDIELERVDGVHGPRRLDVVLIAPPAQGDQDAS